MIRRIECRGAPRDLGMDQGEACRVALRARARRLGFERSVAARLWARLAASDGATRARRAALARELARHLPHLAEQTAGIARGAAVSKDMLLEAILCEAHAGQGTLALEEVSLEGAGSRPALRLLVAALGDAAAEDALLLRTSRPEAGHATLGVGLPWLPAARAGVNEAGLAAAGLPLLDPESRRPGGPPALLLLDQCLERLDRVAAALEWCERRPGTGAARLLFADAKGAVGVLEVRGARRRRVEAGAGVFGPPPPQFGLASIAERRGSPLCVRLDPAARRVEVSRARGSSPTPDVNACL